MITQSHGITKKPHFNTMAVTNYYHIGLCGQVSTGKSTCLNALTGQYLSQVSLKRSTKKVLKFYSTVQGFEENPVTVKEMIEAINSGNNTCNTEDTKFTIEMPLCQDNNNIVLYDFPGFNDGQESIQGMEKLFIDEMVNLDLVIFILDTNSALIHKSEKDVFEMVVKQIEGNRSNGRYTRLIIAFNKYHIDEQCLEYDQDLLDIINEAKKYINNTLNGKNIDYSYTYVSFRNMMIHNIFSNKNAITKDIPLAELHNVLVELYGKNGATKMLAKLKNGEDVFGDSLMLTNYETVFIKELIRCSNHDTHTEYFLSKMKEAVMSRSNTRNLYFNGAPHSCRIYGVEACNILELHKHYVKYNPTKYEECICDMLEENIKLLERSWCINKYNYTKKDMCLVLDDIFLVLEKSGIVTTDKKYLPKVITHMLLRIMDNFIKSDMGCEYNDNVVSTTTIFRIFMMYVKHPERHLSYCSHIWMKYVWFGSGNVSEANISATCRVIHAHQSYLTPLKDMISRVENNTTTTEEIDVIKKFMIYYNAGLLHRDHKNNQSLVMIQVDKIVYIHSAYCEYNGWNDNKDRIQTSLRSNFSFNYNISTDALYPDDDYYSNLFETDAELVKFARYCNKHGTLPQCIINDILLYIASK